MMLSVDQMYDKYPSFSPYAYTLQNPVRYTDPTGMTAEEAHIPVDWYKNLETGDYEYFDGSKQRDGYKNIGASTNLITSQGNNSQSFSLNEDGSFTNIDSGRIYNKGESLTTNNGIGIKSNLTLGEKASRLGSDIVAPFVEVPQDIGTGLINQFNVVINEGAHEGRAYNQDNVLIKNTYKFENWSFVKGGSTQSTGTPSWNEGKEKVMNALSVGLAPFTIYKPVLNTSIPMIDKFAPAVINTATKTGIKKGVEKSMNQIQR